MTEKKGRPFEPALRVDLDQESARDKLLVRVNGTGWERFNKGREG